MIKSTRYKEVNDRDMKKKGVKSPLGLRFHIYDCIGLNLIRKVPSPGGSLTYRLPVA